jgi:group I intron endonuclease
MRKLKYKYDLIYVYMIINKINNMSYIGQHSSDKLFDRYLGGGLLIRKAVKKYGKENFIRVILRICDSKEDAFLNEKYFIDKHNTLFPCGYNLSLTGGQESPGWVSDNTRSKMSKAKEEFVPWNKGLNKHTDDRIYKASLAAIGRKHTSESIKKMREAQQGDKSFRYGNFGDKTPIYGHVFSKESKDQVKNRMMGNNLRKGKKLSEEQRTKLGYPVLQCDVNGNVIQEWVSCAIAAEKLDYHRTALTRCASGLGKTSYGFIWKYKNKPSLKGRMIYKVVQCNLHGRIIKIWDTVKQASVANNISEQSIRRCLRGDNYTTGGFIWVKRDEFEVSDLLNNKIMKKEILNRKEVTL